MIGDSSSCNSPSLQDMRNYETVADITRARLRGAAASLPAEKPGDAELGFRSYKLATSNFRVWSRPGDVGQEGMTEALQLFADNLRAHGANDAVITELSLKAGFELTTPIDILDIVGEVVYSVAAGELLIYLGDALSISMVEEMVSRQPSRILMLDSCFDNHDGLKVNVMQTIRGANEVGGADIVLKVV